MDVTPRRAAYPVLAEKRGIVATILFALVFIALVGEWPVSVDTATYYGKWRSILGVFGPLFLPIPGISLTAWQVLVIALFPFCASAAAAKFHAREMDRAIFLGLLSIFVTVLWGLIKGGSAYFAYYQVWRIMLGLLMGYMLMSVLRTERDLLLLGKLMICAGLLRATACIYYYWAYLRDLDDPYREYVSNHDDSMIFVVAIQVALIWAILKGGKAAWTRAILVAAVILYAILVNDRRIAYVELVLGIPLLYALIGPGPLRKQINRRAMWLGPVFVAYFIAGTVIDHPAFGPVRALVSTGDYQDNSTVAREEENRNLLRTLSESGNAITGTGWGNPYHLVERRYNNYDQSWVLAPYTPHNSLLGLAVFSGLIGIAGIWGVMPVAGYLAARGYRQTLARPVVRGAAMASIGAISAYSAHCYGDIGLQSFPGAVLLGAALGVAGRIGVWASSASAAEPRAALRSPSARRTRLPHPARSEHSLCPSGGGRFRK